MHELAVCRVLLDQVLHIASTRDGQRVQSLTLRIGALAGVEPALLHAAFQLVAFDTPCQDAILEIEDVPVRIRCKICDLNAPARANRLLCPRCGTWRVSLVSGDEMALARIEFSSTPLASERTGSEGPLDV